MTLKLLSSSSSSSFNFVCIKIEVNFYFIFLPPEENEQFLCMTRPAFISAKRAPPDNILALFYLQKENDEMGGKTGLVSYFRSGFHCYEAEKFKNLELIFLRLI